MDEYLTSTDWVAFLADLGDTVAMARRFSKLQEQEILAAYAAWDADEETINELCARLSISRQALYSVLARNDVALKGREGTVMNRADSITKEMSRQALMVLIEEVTNARLRVRDLEEEIASLRSNHVEHPASSPVSPRTRAPRSR